MAVRPSATRWRELSYAGKNNRHSLHFTRLGYFLCFGLILLCLILWLLSLLSWKLYMYPQNFCLLSVWCLLRITSTPIQLLSPYRREPRPYTWPLSFSEEAHSSSPKGIGVPKVLQLKMPKATLTTILHVFLLLGFLITPLGTSSSHFPRVWTSE